MWTVHQLPCEFVDTVVTEARHTESAFVKHMQQLFKITVDMLCP